MAGSEEKSSELPLTHVCRLLVVMLEEVKERVLLSTVEPQQPVDCDALKRAWDALKDAEQAAEAAYFANCQLKPKPDEPIDP